MKKQDKINLDSISGINEDIIDEVTDKKIALSKRAAGRVTSARKRFIAIGSIAASFVLMLSVLLAVIVPLLGSDIPVYQGMTIKKNTQSLSLDEYMITGSKFSFLDSSNGNAYGYSNGNAYGHYKDEHKGHDDKLENDIDSMVNIDVVTDDEVKYYVNPGETFIIEIHIDNPKDYEIQSFTLNGQKYANYMFKEGSTMELLLLEVTAPREPGYVEYTIDAIKYIDGTEIKDVDMSSGDKSVKAGIAYPQAPTAAITSQTVMPTSIELSVNVTDQYSLIGNNELSIYLSDGEKIVETVPLKLGDNSVTFNNLIMSKTYEYGIVTSFDLVDGRDMHKEWILTNKITTAGAFGINNATPTQSSISFEVVRIGEVGEITSISLFDAATDEHVASGGADVREFTGLLSNHTYNLYVDFKYTVNGEEIEDWVAIKGIKTVAKAAPVLEFGKTSSDKTSITYSVNSTDTDGILKVTKAEILKGDKIVKDNGTNLNGKFEELLSNNTYTVKVTYSYDLNDGQGTITEIITKDVTTVAKAAPVLEFGETSSDKTSISYELETTDEDNILNVIKIELLKGDKSVKDNGTNLNGKFEELLSNNTYTVKVTYSYDLNDGQGTITEIITKDVTTVAKAAPVLEFGETSSDKTSISYELETTDEDNILNVTKIELLKDDEAVKDNGTNLNGKFEELLSNNTYTVKVTYTYDLNDGQGAITEIITKDVTTVAKAAPVLEFGETSSDKTSISYELETTDEDNILNVTKIELLKGDKVVKDNGTNLNGKFEELLSNNTYTVKVTYTYDLNDGQGAITKSVTKSVKTVAKAAPKITFSDISVTDSTITGKYNVTDVDNVGTVSSVELYKNGISVKSNGQKDLSFTGLEYYTNYQIAVSYTFDLNDGVGTKKKTATYDLTTSPHLVFNSCDVVNTSAVSEGETIFMQINITNPNKVVYTKIAVNGEEYDVVKNSSTATMLYCEIVNKGQFEGGDTALTVEKVIAELDGKTYTIEPKENNVSSVFINGKLELESLSAVIFKDGKYISTDYVFPSDQAYLLLKLKNKTGYNIDSIQLDSHMSIYGYDPFDYTYTKLDDEHYLIEIISQADDKEIFTGTNIYYLRSIQYSREDLSNSLQFDLKHTASKCSVFWLESDEIQYVSTPEDLMNMNVGAKYYELTADIDLSGIEWSGNEFYGVLNGKGYSIRNMSFVGTITNSNAYLGLFSQGNGVINDLNIVNARYIVRKDSTDGNDYIINFGCIIGYANGYGLTLNNCNVDKSSFINIDGHSIGGLVGRIERGNINNCTNAGSISGESYVGGIVGAGLDDVVIFACSNSGSVSGKFEAGGIIGTGGVTIACSNYGDINADNGVENDTYAGGISGHGVAENCVNFGSITGTSIAGGITGVSTSVTNCANFGAVTVTGYRNPGGIVHLAHRNISNCLNYGEISGGEDSGDELRCDITPLPSSASITNCYAIGDNVTVAQLNSKSFYTDTLGWSEDVWNLDGLDIENGKYPTLK